MKGTYKDIQEYIREKYKFVAQTCWIADVKEMCGLKVEKAHNRLSDDSRVKKCPKEKIGYIKEALRYFDII